MVKFKRVPPDDPRIKLSIESRDIVANLFQDERGVYARVVNFRTQERFEIGFVGARDASKISKTEFERIVKMHLRRRSSKYR